jgi:hypothetical protein
MTTYADFLEFYIGVQNSVEIENTQQTIYTPAGGRFGRVNISIISGSSDEIFGFNVEATVLLGSTVIYNEVDFFDAMLTDIKVPAGQFIQVKAVGDDPIIFTVTGAEFNEEIDW